MPKEIERKFLVNPSKLPRLGKGQVITQGFLCFDPVTRVRIIDKKAFLTVKGGGNPAAMCYPYGPLQREEFEYPIPVEAAEAMFRLCTGGYIMRKTRYLLGRWEIDEFIGPPDLKGLWLAEIELKSEKEKVEIPDWTYREVTSNRVFQNAMLSKRPWDAQTYFKPPQASRKHS